MSQELIKAINALTDYIIFLQWSIHNPEKAKIPQVTVDNYKLQLRVTKVKHKARIKQLNQNELSIVQAYQKLRSAECPINSKTAPAPLDPNPQLQKDTSQDRDPKEHASLPSMVNGLQNSRSRVFARLSSIF